MQNSKIYSVAELTNEIKKMLGSIYKDIWISGEISNLKPSAAGHYYLNLKDKNAVISCALFKNYTYGLKFKPENGLEVICQGQIDVYPPRGNYQLIIKKMEPKGIGALQIAFDQLKQKLKDEGLFNKDIKKNLPLLPKKIALITSPTGAAVKDLINVISRRYNNINILILPVKVQGEGAKEEIALAIETTNNYKLADIIIAGRGGGSIEDLWAFNEEIVARAIAKSKIPVISAVGHETDFTIADFVADLRAPTPSAAAELAIPVKYDLLQNLHSQKSRLVNAVQYKIQECKGQLLNAEKLIENPEPVINNMRMIVDDLSQKNINLLKQKIASYKQYLLKIENRLNSKNPVKEIDNYKIQFNNFKNQLTNYIKYIIQSDSVLLNNYKNELEPLINKITTKKRSTLAELAGKLDELSPLAVLKRGYSITKFKSSNKIITSYKQVEKNDIVTVSLYDGVLDCNVIDIGTYKDKN